MIETKQFFALFEERVVGEILRDIANWFREVTPSRCLIVSGGGGYLWMQ